MPFASKAQRAFLAMHHPKVAHEFAKETPEDAKLPEHVRKLSAGGHACMHCGGRTEADGYAMGDIAGEALEPVVVKREIEGDSPMSRGFTGEGWEGEEREPEEDSDTEQHEGSVLNRTLAFADAIGRKAFARGGEVPEQRPPEPPQEDAGESVSLERLKRAKYGFGKRW